MMKPNIIFLILDAARQDMFGCYGSQENLTPNIDALAAEGIVLKRHYAAGCGSAQAHVSIFTGQHSERHRMVHNFCTLDKNIKTIPLLLNKIGYRSYGHMVANICPPAGYRELFGFDEMVSPEAKQEASNKGSQSSSLKTRMMTGLKQIAYKVLPEKTRKQISARIYDGEKSLNYLYEKIRDNKDKQPVFAYSTLLHPHLPYMPPRRFLKQVFQERKINNMAFTLQTQHHAYSNGDFKDAEDALDSLQRLYKGELLYADYLVGNFITKLKQDGLLDNTILAVMSDHGEYLGEHGLLTHGSLVWEELFNIPCVIRYPEKITPGSTMDNMTSAMDLFPTLMGLIGESDFAAGETDFDGIDLFQNMPDGAKRILVVDSPPAVAPQRLSKYPNLLYKVSQISRAARTKEHKYIWQSNGMEYLFAAGTKENDANNIINDNRQIADDLKAEMLSFYTGINSDFKMDEYPLNLNRNLAGKIPNPEIAKELRKLGYLE